MSGGDIMAENELVEELQYLRLRLSSVGGSGMLVG